LNLLTLSITSSRRFKIRKEFPQTNNVLFLLENSLKMDVPYQGAYGIPQALPGSRMASAGPDWQNNAATQIRWGLEYIKGTYGSPCGAWDHEQATGWY
jgi:hypothetical protein